MLERTLYIFLDYDMCSSILFKEQLDQIIKVLSKKTTIPIDDLSKFCDYYNSQRGLHPFQKLTVAKRIDKIIDQYCASLLPRKIDHIFSEVTNYLARFLELRVFFLKTLNNLARQYKRVVLLTGSRRQSKSQDQKIADKNQNGLCTVNFPQLAAEQGWEFDPTLFPDTFDDPTKVNLHANWFDHINKQLSLDEEGDFYTFDDLPLTEVIEYFKKNKKSVSENLHFLMGHFKWPDLVKKDDCIYQITFRSICDRRLKKPSCSLPTKAPDEAKIKNEVSFFGISYSMIFKPSISQTINEKTMRALTKF